MRVNFFPLLAGWSHYISHADAMKINGPVMFVRDLNNCHDANAIKVHYNGTHIGHVPADVAEIIAPMFDANHHFSGTAKTSDGGKFRDYNDIVEWAHITLSMFSSDLPDDIALRLCHIEYVPAFYMFDNRFQPAQRTRADWKALGRNVRPLAIPRHTTERYREIVDAYSVAVLTVPKNTGLWDINLRQMK
jgi:hypothetical protein